MDTLFYKVKLNLNYKLFTNLELGLKGVVGTELKLSNLIFFDCDNSGETSCFLFPESETEAAGVGVADLELWALFGFLMSFSLSLGTSESESKSLEKSLDESLPGADFFESFFFDCFFFFFLSFRFSPSFPDLSLS